MRALAADAVRSRQRLAPSPSLSILVVLLAALVVAACGDGDPKGGDDDRGGKRDAKTSSTAAEHPDDDPDAPSGSTDNPADVTIGEDPLGDPVAPSTQTDPDEHPVPTEGSRITIVDPKPFTTVVGSVRIRAKVPCTAAARVKWGVTRGDAKAIASGSFPRKLQRGGTCDVATTANLASVPEGSYELHVSTFDGKGTMEGDTLVPISVHKQADPDAVAPDAPPPG